MFPKSKSLLTKLFRHTHKTIRNPKPNRTRLGVDRLEDRLVPSTATLDLADNVLRVEAADGADNIQIYQPGDGSVSVSGVQIAVTDLDGNTTLADTVPEDQVAEIDVNALRGDDSIYVGNADAAAPIPVVVNGGAITFASTDEASAVSSAIQARYDGLGGPDGFLGQATADETDAPGGGRVATFAGGSIYYYADTGTSWAVSSATQAKYDGLGGASSFLGQPTADETDAQGGGRVTTFDGGAIYTTDSGDVWATSSVIQAKYDGLGGAASFLGQPTADETDAPAGDRVATFAGGAIYTTSSGDAWAMSSVIQAKYVGLGEGAGYLGQPTADETNAPGGGRVVAFQGGSISNSTAGIWVVSASTIAIQAKYASLGGAGGILGVQTAAETDAPNAGRMVAYQHGSIYWSLATGGAWEIHGAIKDKYVASASLTDAYGKSVQGILGLPTGDQVTLSSGVWVSHFQHGDIYAITGTGVFALYGAIKDKYDVTAGMKDAYGNNVQGILKLPISDEVPTAGGGRVVHFQGGDVYANLNVGAAYAVYGAIKVKYNAMGGPGGKAGLPTSDEMAVTGGRVQRFAGADLYAILNVGVFEVNGAIRVEYNQPNVAATIGLPITDETTITGGWYNNFQKGSIYALGAAADHQAHEIHGPIRDHWVALGGVQGLLGFPTTDVFNPGDGSQVTIFQGGTISWRADVGFHLGFNHNQVIAALKNSEADGVLDGNEFNFFHSIANDPQIFVDDPTRVLTRKLIDGDRSDLIYQGVKVGYLAANSPAWKVDDLERKWFEGQDHPNAVFNRTVPVTPSTPSGVIQVNGGKYSTVAGPLFGASGPVYTDVSQGILGDCSLLASLAEVAARDPVTIQDMFTDNGDGTYSVRFMHNGLPDYVTVDSQLPSGGTAFDKPTAGPIWAALAEKAYAQINESGWLNTLLPGQNTYGALDGVNVAACLAAVTGRAAVNNPNATGIASPWTNGQMIVLTTVNPSNSQIVPNHAYAVIGAQIGSTSATTWFRVFNPWGEAGGTLNKVFKPGELWINQDGVTQNFSYSSTTPPGAGLAQPTLTADLSLPPSATTTDSKHAASPQLPSHFVAPAAEAPAAEALATEAPALPASDQFPPVTHRHDQLEEALNGWAVALEV